MEVTGWWNASHPVSNPDSGRADPAQLRAPAPFDNGAVRKTREKSRERFEPQ
jgi:hypothetical protein